MRSLLERKWCGKDGITAEVIDMQRRADGPVV